MKALSLWQPWASLMALGLKKIETRGWYCGHRGPLVIAATKTWNRDVFNELHAVAARLRIWDDNESTWRMIVDALATAGVKRLSDLPLGKALCVVNVTGCERTLFAARTRSEEAFGDFSAGRWAILTDGCKRFPEPIPCSGKQMLWDFPMTTDLIPR